MGNRSISFKDKKLEGWIEEMSKRKNMKISEFICNILEREMNARLIGTTSEQLRADIDETKHKLAVLEHQEIGVRMEEDERAQNARKFADIILKLETFTPEMLAESANEWLTKQTDEKKADFYGYMRACGFKKVGEAYLAYVREGLS